VVGREDALRDANWANACFCTRAPNLVANILTTREIVLEKLDVGKGKLQLVASVGAKIL